MTDRPEAPEEDFAAMFAASERATAKTQRPRFALGDRVRGKVVSIGDEVTVLELAGGGEGTLETLELRDPAGQLTVKLGDTIEARVVALGEKQGFVTVRRGAIQAGGRADLAEAVTTGLPIEGLVSGVNKGGLDVDIGGIRGFCPLSQLDLRPVADPAVFVGQRLAFRVTRYEDDRRGANIVLSRRALLEEEARGRAVETRSKLIVGAVLPGVVTAVKDFGAFVDVGGIEGLLPASEISFQRGTRPSDVLTVGQPVTVQVMRIEKRDEPPAMRSAGRSPSSRDARHPEQVSFSLKALEQDPWQEVTTRFPAGTVARGRVARLEAFGAFIELVPGIEGLLHISELGAGKPLRHARDALKVGDSIDVAVLGSEPEKRRISLGLAGREAGVDDEGRAAADRASGARGSMGTLGDLLKGKL
jgi:small subunit ribosomal protein S1